MVILATTSIGSCENNERHLEVRFGRVETEAGGRQVFGTVAKADKDIKVLIHRSLDHEPGRGRCRRPGTAYGPLPSVSTGFVRRVLHNDGIGHAGGIISYAAGGRQYIAVVAGWGSLVGEGYAAMFGEPYKSMPMDAGALIVYALPTRRCRTATAMMPTGTGSFPAPFSLWRTQCQSSGGT